MRKLLINTETGLVTNVIVVPDGGEVSSPAGHEVADAGDGVGIGWRRTGDGFAPPPPPLPTASDVRREADRRMQALLGARDSDQLDIIIANGTREAVRLLRKGAATWTTEEAQRAAVLEVIDRAIEAIRAASNALEAAPPADFADDRHWPA